MIIITIDGPVASGKSTVSRLLAHKLDFYYLCSGLLYRAIAYVLINTYTYNIDMLSAVRMDDLAQCVDASRLLYTYDELSQERVFFDSEDITPYLKDRLIDQATSIISVDRHVREAVTAIQRRIASTYDSVIDGRDVGSVVFPDAQVKFFITASVTVRAERWRKDQERYDNHFSLEQAIALIADRDNRDKNRTVAPLVVPRGAIVIDTSLLSVDDVIEQMIQHVNHFL